MFDVWSNRGRCRQESVYLSSTWCLYNDHRLGYRHDYSIFYQLPNSNLFTHRALYSWEKPLVNPTPPGLLFHHIAFRSTFLQSLFSDLQNQKPKNILLHILFALFILCSWEIYLSYLSLPNLSFYRIDWQPLFRVGLQVFVVCVQVLLIGWWWSSNWFDNLGFITEGNTDVYYATLFL